MQMHAKYIAVAFFFELLFLRVVLFYGPGSPLPLVPPLWAGGRPYPLPRLPIPWAEQRVGAEVVECRAL